jgi:hypothetical protein
MVTSILGTDAAGIAAVQSLTQDLRANRDDAMLALRDVEVINSIERLAKRATHSAITVLTLLASQAVLSTAVKETDGQ